MVYSGRFPAIGPEVTEKFRPGEIRSRNEIEYWPEAPRRRFTQEMQTGDGRYEAAVEYGRAFGHSQFLLNIRTKKAVPGAVHPIARGDDHVIDKPLTSAGQLEMKLFSG